MSTLNTALLAIDLQKGWIGLPVVPPIHPVPAHASDTAQTSASLVDDVAEGG